MTPNETDRRAESTRDGGAGPGPGPGDSDAGFHAVFGPAGDDLGETLRAAEPRVREILASHPVPLLLGALATGYLLARLVRSQDP